VAAHASGEYPQCLATIMAWLMMEWIAFVFVGVLAVGLVMICSGAVFLFWCDVWKRLHHERS